MNNDWIIYLQVVRNSTKNIEFKFFQQINQENVHFEKKKDKPGKCLKENENSYIYNGT